MRARSRAAVAVLLALAALTAVASPAAAATTVFQGAFVCEDGRPLAGARVELWSWEETWLPKIWPNARQRIAVNADANGGWGFRVSGDETNWYVRVVLSSAEVEVSDFPLPWNRFADTPSNQNDVALQDYGAQRMPGYQCGLWNGFRDAVLEYEGQTGSRPPQGEVEVTAGALTAGVPFSLYQDVQWPSGYRVVEQDGTSVAQHEFAHTFRHTFDGDFGHFLGDAGFYWYLRHHSATSCDATNSGFAFNEGWAEYWAGDVMTPCSNPSDHRVERNVAAALQRLQQQCRFTRGRMVEVLAANRGRIHSFDEFSEAARRAGCPSLRELLLTPAKKAKRGGLDAVVAGRVLVGRRFARPLDRRAAQLERARRAAERALGRWSPCRERPCEALAARVLRPLLLGGRADAARALRASFAFATNRSALRALARRPVAAQLRRYDRARRLARKRLAQVAARTYRRAVGRLARVDPTSSLGIARAALRRARRGGVGALQAVVPGAPPALLRTGPSPEGIAIAGEPPPPAPARAASTLQIESACNGAGWTPQDDGFARVGGRLLPGRSGSQVTVTHRRFRGADELAPLVHSVTTDADGRWIDSITAAEWAAGYGPRWEIRATFVGDAERAPSESATCTVNARYP